MIEVKLVGFVNRLQSATKKLALANLNRRSIRAVAKFNKLETHIANSREYLEDLEEIIEADFQKKDAAIVAAYQQVRAMYSYVLSGC